MPEKIKIECSACGATGIYRGFAEPKGVGVICVECKGTGCKLLAYTPFRCRKQRQDVVTVCRSRGGFIATGIGPDAGGSVSYKDFLAGKVPGNWEESDG